MTRRGLPLHSARPLIAAVFVIGVLTAGCARGTAARSAAATPADHAQAGAGSKPGTALKNKSLRDGELVALPLEAYIADTSQSNAIDEATNELIDTCMRGKGFTVPQPTSLQEKIGQSTSSTQLQEPYGITSPRLAAQYGYSSPAPKHLKLPHGAHSFGPGTFGPKESPAYYTALVGYPSGIPPAGYDTVKGCSGQVYNELDGGPMPVDPHDVVGMLAGEAEQDTAGNRAVISALSAWSSCMSAKGYSYQTPMQAASARWPASPGPLEISTAKGDVACKEKTGLPLIWQRAEAGYERALVNQNAAALNQVKQATDAEIRRAEAQLARSGS